MTVLRASADRGAATLWAAALMAVLLLVGLGCLAIAQQALTRQRAATAADLAAIAGAQAIEDPCARAQAYAERNGAELVECRATVLADGPEVDVTVRMPAPQLVVHLFDLLGRDARPVVVRAHAGPPA